MTTKANKTGLNTKQIKAAKMLADPAFSGTVTELCENINVARSTFYDWMEKPAFRSYLDSLIELYTDSELSRAWRALLRQIDKGDTQAIKLYFELKGKYKPGIGQTRDTGGGPPNNLLTVIKDSTKSEDADGIHKVQPEPADRPALVE